MANCFADNLVSGEYVAYATSGPQFVDCLRQYICFNGKVVHSLVRGQYVGYATSGGFVCVVCYVYPQRRYITPFRTDFCHLYNANLKATP